MAKITTHYVGDSLTETLLRDKIAEGIRLTPHEQSIIDKADQYEADVLKASVKSSKASSWFKKLVKLIKELFEKDDPVDPSNPDAPVDPVEPVTPPTPTTGDEIDFSLLQWKYGGFSGGNAKLDGPTLANLSCNGRAVSYKWVTDMKMWGFGNADAKAIFAWFFLIEGQWIGGKGDWVSVTRSSRELKHTESYSNWPQSGIKLPFKGRIACVVSHSDGKRRSNVVVTEAK